MATIKVFDVNGVKELNCFDTAAQVPYLSVEEEEVGAPDDTDAPE